MLAGALVIVAVGVLLPAAAAADLYVSPFSLRDPDVYFNMTIPAVSPFFTYHGNWSDGGEDGPTMIGYKANMSSYVAGVAATVNTYRGPGGNATNFDIPPGQLHADLPRIDGANGGDGRWVFPYRTAKMSYVFALVHEVQPGNSLMLENMTIQTGMYTEATRWEDVHCVTEGFTKNASLPITFQGGMWAPNGDAQSAWGGAVLATLPQNTSFVWVNASAVTGASIMSGNVLNIFMTEGTNPLNFQQITLNTVRSYNARNMIVYQAPLDPTDRYTLTLSAPVNHQMILNSITYCSYYKGGIIPAPPKKSNAALIGGVVGGVGGGVVILAILGFVLWRRGCFGKRKTARKGELRALEVGDRTSHAFVVDESVRVQPTPFKRGMLGSIAVPRSDSPTQLDASSPGSDWPAEYETKLRMLANGQLQHAHERSGDSNISHGLSHAHSFYSDTKGRAMSDSSSALPTPIVGRGMSGDSPTPALSPGGGRAMSGDSFLTATSRGMSGDSAMTPMTPTVDQQKSLDGGPLPPRAYRPRRQRPTRHIVEHAEDGGEVRVENGEQVVVETLPPQYRPEWEERRRQLQEQEQEQEQLPQPQLQQQPEQGQLLAQQEQQLQQEQRPQPAQQQSQPAQQPPQ